MEKLKHTSQNSCSVLIGHKLYQGTEGKLKARHSNQADVNIMHGRETFGGDIFPAQKPNSPIVQLSGQVSVVLLCRVNIAKISAGCYAHLCRS
jgi:hypothetical protein